MSAATAGSSASPSVSEEGSFSLYPIGSPEATQRAMAELDHAIDGCAWREDSAEMAYATAVSLHASAIRGAPPPPRLACTVEVDSNERWSLHRVGPFQSAGGSWHQVLSPDLFSFAPRLDQRGAPPPRWVTAHGAFVLDAHFSRSLEPISNHHSQLYLDPAGYEQFSLIHQDSICYPRAGGLACNLQSLPTGTGFRIESPVRFEALYHDERALSSPPIPFHILIALRYTQQAPASELVLFQASLAYNPSPPFFTFAIPSDEPSAWWHTTIPSVSGRVLTWWQHSHGRLGCTETWYIQGDANSLGLRPARLCEAYVPRVHGETIATLKASILQHMRASGARFRCIAAQPKQGKQDFQPEQRCFEGAETLTAGEPFTAVQFFEPEVHLAAPPLQQHLHYQAIVDTGVRQRFTVKHELPDHGPGCARAHGAPVGDTLGETYSWKWPCVGECDAFYEYQYRFPDPHGNASKLLSTAHPDFALSSWIAVVGLIFALALGLARSRRTNAIPSHMALC
ncbi:hypothetical protein AB1Y20_019046 [Prymnesium parvum]|uniref:Protein PBN1 n=1 Tax=Prymnesium parvum TaxID=97485 RepID=A0AB34JT19_PRYPA